MALFHDNAIVDDMAMLSLAAYALNLKQDRSFVPDLSLGWSAVAGIESDITKGAYADGVYRHDYSLLLAKNTAVAIVAEKDSTLAISFRGSAADVRQKKGTTSIVDDWTAAADDQSAHFKALQEVIEAALKYAADASNGITDVYVTGHSLGGAMAEFVAARYSLFEDILPTGNIHFVTFGSPGVARTDANPLDLPVEQIGHSRDPIFEQDVPIFDLSGLTRAEDRITVHLPFVPGGLVNFPGGFVPQHRMVQYVDTAGALSGSALVDWADREFAIYVGREKEKNPVGTDTFGKGGSAADQFLVGRNGMEVLTGGRGADLLDGGGSADTLRGAQDNDRLSGGAEGDLIVGGGGFDFAHYNGSHLGLVVSIANPGTNTGDAAGDTYRSIEGLYGSRYADRLTGDGAGNKILGGGGDDQLTGRPGNDTISGGTGHDTMSGGQGNDLLVGMGGEDRFVFNTALNAQTNVDTIRNYEIAEDRIVLDRSVFATLGPGATLPADEFHIGPTATEPEHRIVYNPNTGALLYDADGSEAGKGVRFAFLEDNLALTNADFLIV